MWGYQVAMLQIFNYSRINWLDDHLSDDQQRHVGNDVEDQKSNFEQPEERVINHVEGFSGNWKPFVLRTVHQIRGQ
jgi:hypothetical protein